MKEKKLLPPPWIACPEIPQGSIGWRMGYGEGYLIDWYAWHDTLSKEEQEEYRRLFPEPSTWKATTQWFKHDGFFIQKWRENGAPEYSLEGVREAYARGEKQEFLFFWGHRASRDGTIKKSCFSQWWPSEFRNGHLKYDCMEQFMMAKKAELFQDKEICQQIMNTCDQAAIKALGRKVKNFDEALWNQAKYLIVLNGNYMKFSQNEELRNFLLSTGDAVLVEASPYDRVWGIGMKERDAGVSDPHNWCGQNLLGFALMEVRNEIRRVWANVELCEKVENLR